MINREQGFSMLEVILAAALFVIFATGLVTVTIQGLDANRLGQEQTIASQFASEGLEAVKSIQNQSFVNLTDSNGEGLTRTNGLWAFNSGADIFDKYSRTITVSDVYRDASGNIISSGGTLDPKTKKVTSTVTWNFSGNRNDSVDVSSYFTNWRGAINGGRGGMIIYQDGGTATDSVKYKLLDGSSQSWGGVGLVPAVSPSQDRVLRTAKLYSASTRNEKVLLSRRFDTKLQYIYAQVWNGSTWTSQLLSSWSSTDFLDVQNFDGTYLNNGSFLVVYSDNTSIPKYRIWNGSVWSSQASLTDLAINGSGIPLWIVARARPSSNEAMIALLDQNKNVNTEYFNGATFLLQAIHTKFTKAVSQDFIDFNWSPVNSLQGALLYVDKNNNKELDIQIWTADGLGSGSWSVPQPIQTVNSSTNLGPDRLISFSLSNNYLACDQDTSTNIKCYASSNAPTWSIPTNNTLTTTSDNGTQRAFDVGFSSLSGLGLVVFSDSTNQLKYKQFDSSGNSFDLVTSEVSSPASGTIKTVSVVPEPASNDMMILFADSTNTLYSLVWNGTSRSMYTTPAGLALNSPGSSGTSNSSYWFDFAWDGF